MDSERSKFNAKEFCKRQFDLKGWRQNKNQISYDRAELITLCDLVTELFRNEPTLAEIATPVTIVGDIHGQFPDLVRLLNARSYKQTENQRQIYGFSSRRWVFLGDYVDRGLNSLECICTVFALKVLYPEQYLLLRGNHETQTINFTYGFFDELTRRLGKIDGVDMWNRFNSTFQWMPLAALVGNHILCMHGGISPDLKTLDDIRNIRRPLPDIHTSSLALDLLWADPEENDKKSPTYVRNWNRGLSVFFNEAAVKDVVKKCDLSLIVRAHQMMPNGFKYFADHKMCTIFSAPRYMNQMDNRGAVMTISKEGKVGITMMKKSKVMSEMSMSNKEEAEKAAQKSASLPVVENSEQIIDISR